ncbi:MAG TPA: TadE family protein [Gemmataceae bacterium]|nr:TadE family protein [Gemmataceae bacterium]
MRQLRQARPRRGATAVETALVLGACLLLFFGLFEYGRFVMVRQLLDNAAREGARQAVVSTNSLTAADIQNTVTAYMAGQQPAGFAVQVYKADPATGANLGSWDTAAFGDAIAVKASATYQPLLPTLGLLPSSVPVQATVIMRSEAN